MRASEGLDPLRSGLPRPSPSQVLSLPATSSSTNTPRTPAPRAWSQFPYSIHRRHQLQRRPRMINAFHWARLYVRSVYVDVMSRDSLDLFLSSRACPPRPPHPPLQPRLHRQMADHILDPPPPAHRCRRQVLHHLRHACPAATGPPHILDSSALSLRYAQADAHGVHRPASSPSPIRN